MLNLVAAVLAVASLPLVPATAQTVYRIVGADGRVTFSDRPAKEAAQAATPSSAGSAAADPNAALPYALRQTASRFPVMLYTGTDCTPCDSARQLLQSRGIPYAERTVQTDVDASVLQKLSGQTSLPFATIGKQHLVGFSMGDWTQYLNAAGYPASSQLPPQYRRPAAQPLTTPAPAKPAAAAQAPAPADSPRDGRAPLPAPGAPTSDNPAGLTF